MSRPTVTTLPGRLLLDLLFVLLLLVIFLVLIYMRNQISQSPQFERSLRLADGLNLYRSIRGAERNALRHERPTNTTLGELDIHQQMSVFIENKARLVFENCPIRVIFSQRQGMNVFREDAAFQHFNKHHLDIIASLPRFQYVLDIQDEGIFWLINRPPASEIGRFGTT